MKPVQKLQPSEYEKKWPSCVPITSGLRAGKQNRLTPEAFESKWQKIWEEKKVYQPDLQNAPKPFYNLMMFPYPSAEGLHVGNMYAFTGADIFGRFMRMKGYDVFEPIGLDGFGIHSENYAIKIGKHPMEQSKVSEENFYRQLSSIGNSFAWDHRLETYDPAYYKWTQWIFVQMFKHGLAYRKKSPVNFCPSCKTVLSDEQVIEGRCERCKSVVEKREMEQWFFKITKYADRLLKNIETLDWTNKVKIGQRNWIGKKEGIHITYPIDGTSEKVTIFTTAPVNFGMTFLVLSPEHPLTKKIIHGEVEVPAKNRAAVEKYVNLARKKTEQERIAEGKEKTGVCTGLFALNCINGKKVPVWVTDFVLGHVGTGAVQGCPGHDRKDFQFAKKFGLPIVRVIVGPDGDKGPIEHEEQVIEKGQKGDFVNSAFLNSLSFEEGLQKTMDFFEEKGWGKRVVEYKLRDWCISRQRYWGAPIPMIDCPTCGWVAVSEKDLPVLLPADVADWKPEGTGKGPLAKIESFVKVTCPECGQAARRETDVCDTFLDSSWYHLRYPSVGQKRHSGKEQRDNSRIRMGSFANAQDDDSLPWDPQLTRKWLPVHQYIGGAEHTVLHLLYARFVWMCFYDWGLFDFSARGRIASGWDEPYTRFYAHGLIIAEGAKMSKSRGNVIIPDSYIKKYGADTLRTYLMFLGPFNQGGDFRDTGIAGMYRFLSRVWRLVREYQISNIKYQKRESSKNTSDDIGISKKLNTPREWQAERSEAMTLPMVEKSEITRIMHRAVKEVTNDLTNLRYNTAIAHIMEYVNQLTDNREQITDEHIKALLLLLAPFAPHMTEELWQNFKFHPDQIGTNFKFQSIHLHPWPSYDEKFLTEDTVTVVIQVNGKLRHSFGVDREKASDQAEIEKGARNSAKIQKHIEGKSIKKVIFIPGKLLNFVV